MADVGDLSEYFIYSAVQDAFYKMSGGKNYLVRQQMGAVSLLFVRKISADNFDSEGSPDRADAGLITTMDGIFSSFIETNRSVGNLSSMAYNFVFIIDSAVKTTKGRETLETFNDLMRNNQKKLDDFGFISEIIILDISVPEHHTISGRGLLDRGLKKSLEKTTSACNLSEDNRKNEKEDYFASIRKARAELKPVAHGKNHNPVKILIFTNIVIFLAGMFLHYKYGVDYFVEYGIQDNELIRQGEIWRLFTPIFLHADFAHLAGNMISLMYLGAVVRRYYADAHFWLIYFISGVVGNIASFMFTDYLSLGASGAIMGLGGVLVYRMFVGPSSRVFRNTGNYLILGFVVFFNLFYGLFTEGIDNYGHFGGFIAGFIIAAVLMKLKDKRIKQKNQA